MKKFFVFLIINYIIIHIAAFPQLANDIVNTGWGESGNFCFENVAVRGQKEFPEYAGLHPV